MGDDRKRLVLLVEGKGDVKSCVVIAKRLISQQPGNPWNLLSLDESPMRIGAVDCITGRLQNAWINHLKAAYNRGGVGGILLIQDGDKDIIEKKAFCPVAVAHDLAQRAREAGAGTMFSLACVFAMMEFEAWLIAGIESLAGRPLPDGRKGLLLGTKAPDGIEQIRGAKGWLGRHMATRSYKATLDQRPFTEMVSIDEIRSRNIRSFQRLENAIAQLVNAIRSGKHIVSPSA